MSLGEILDDPIGYSIRGSEVSQIGASYEENTADEILNATLEMVQRDGIEKESDTGAARLVNEIRSDKGAVSHGRIPDSFLSAHQRWLM